jgi:hypothetical protein
MKPKKLLLYTQQLNDQIRFVQSFIQKKEVSIWAATVLYIAIIGFSLSFVLELKIIQDFTIKGLFIITILIITQIFIVFIYSQFSVWIYSIVHFKTLRKGILKITFNPEKIKIEDLNYDMKYDLPEFLLPVYQKEQLLENQFHEKKRPIKIFGYTLLGLITLFLSKTWREKLKKNREKQEGLIYLLIIIIWICFNIVTIIK